MTQLSSIFVAIYSNILPFTILLGILVFVHEFGHFIVARMCGVRVEVFSLGFGKKIFSFKRGDTTYCISLIPLGGYVKMFGEMGSEAILTEEDKKVSFSHKSPWKRIAVVLAGPLMNFVFAIFIFTIIAELGEQSRAAVIADVTVNSPAAQLGLKPGDRILEVNSVKIKNYEDFQKILNQFKDSSVSAVLVDVGGQKKDLNLKVTSIDNPNIFSLESKLGQIEGVLPYAKSGVVAVITGSLAYQSGLRTGDEIIEINSQKITQWAQLEALMLNTKSDLSIKLNREATTNSNENSKETKPSASNSVVLTVSGSELAKIKSLNDFGLDNTDLYLDQVVKDSPAEAAGLAKYDKILSINSIKIKKWENVSEVIKGFDEKEAMTFVLSRDGAELIKKITPKATELTTAFGGIEKRFAVGITPYIMFAEPELVVTKSESIFHSIAKGTERTVDISVMTVMSFIKLLQGQVSVKNVGGMVSIGKAAGDAFQVGAQAFLMTMGILSVSLFILNLLPIPVLDGGHLVFYTIELIKGSPLSLKKMEIAQQVGFVLLMGLMVLAQYNDIVRFLF